MLFNKYNKSMFVCSKRSVFNVSKPAFYKVLKKIFKFTGYKLQMFACF